MLRPPALAVACTFFLAWCSTRPSTDSAALGRSHRPT
jgi:hypothetical protein